MFSKATAAAGEYGTARRLSAVAVLGAALFAATACSSQSAGQGSGPAADAGSASAAPTAAQKAQVALTTGIALISNGTAAVKVGSNTVTFPTTVTDAAWSPDGSRIAFIDAQGNVATARPDGTGLIELTKTNPKVTRSHPTWEGAEVVFAEKSSTGFGTIQSVTMPTVAGSPIAEQAVFTGTDTTGNQITNNLAPSAEAPDPADLTGSLAFQHAGSAGPEVWIVDFAQRESEGWKLIAGSDPALSPDGSTVAFVDPAGQIETAPTASPAGKAVHPVQVTFGAASPTELGWSSDGKRVTYSQASGIYSVAAAPAGHTSNPATQVSTTPGTVTYLSAGPGSQAYQFTGTDPVALSIAASQDRWSTVDDYQQSQSIIPATSAFIGSSTELASDLNLLPENTFQGPLLLTGGQTLDPKVATELHRIFGSADQGEKPTVYLLGDTTKISSAIQTAITQMGYQTQRVTTPHTGGQAAGSNVPELSANRYLSFVAVDQNNPLDDLLGTAFAGAYRTPAVMVGDNTTLPTSAAGWIAQAGGWITDPAIFAPAQNSTALATAINTIEGSPFGEAIVVNPAKPFGNS